VQLLSSPVTRGDQEAVREERFKMVSGEIAHCAYMAELNMIYQMEVDGNMQIV